MSDPRDPAAWTERDLLDDVASGPQGPGVAAVFDVDGTLLDGRALAAFARHQVRSGHVTPSDLGRMLLVGLRLRDGVDADAERRFAQGLRAWAGRSEDELVELGERLWRQAVAGALHPEAWRLVAAHRRAGHTLVLASAATRFQVEPLARALGVEHALVTAVGFADGLATGRPAGALLRGAAKAAAVRSFAAAHGVDLARSWAYSGSADDLPLLRAGGRVRAIDPDPALAAEAARRGWPVVRFRERGPSGPREVVRAVGAVAGTLGGFGAGLALGGLQALVGSGTRRDAVDLGIALAGDLGTALAGVRIEVTGAEHLASARPAVFLFNHQSQLDVPVLAKVLRGGFTAVAKKEAAAIPGFGAAFRLADIAFVDRGNTTAARAALEPAVQRLREGLSLAVAPEGTRSTTPALGPFKKGAFHMAMQAGVPVVPIVVHDAGELMWRGANTVRGGVVHVTVLPPVPTDGWRAGTLDAHVAAVRAQYLAALGQEDLPPVVPRVVEVAAPAAEPLPWDDAPPEVSPGAAAAWRSGADDPRATLTLLERLDPPVDPERILAAHEWASRMVPRMRQVVTGTGPSRWSTVEHLDLDHHVRRLRLPAPGTDAQLRAAVAAFAAAPLDRRRPLWSALLVEGLEGGGAAYAVTVHRSVTDGVGAVRLLGLLHSRTAEPDPARPEPPPPAATPAPHPAAALLDGPARAAAAAVAHPLGAAADLLRRLRPAAPAPASALAGRGGARRIATLDTGWDDLVAGAAAAGGSAADALLASVLAALGDHLPAPARISVGLPVAMGAEDGAGGRLGGAVVDVDLHDPALAGPVADRIAAVRELVLDTGPAEAGRVADVQVATVPGIGHPVHLAGSRITRLHPLGPLAGGAATVTLVAHDGVACVGVVVDDAAVPDPDGLARRMEARLAEVAARPATTPPPGARAGRARRRVGGAAGGGAPDGAAAGRSAGAS